MTTTTDRWQTLVAGMGIVMVVLGLRIGILIQANRYADDARPAAPMAAPVETPWAPHLRVVDEALAQKNVSRALHAWRDAYGAALGSRQWEGVLAVGDAYLKIGEAAEFRRGAETTARRSYLSALMLARRDGSLEGILKSAAAFQALGDRDVVRQAVRIAVAVAPGLTEDGARSRIRALAEAGEAPRMAGAVPSSPR